MAICGREKTNNAVFTAKTKTAAVLQPRNCHIHPDWNSNGSLSLGSILHDNDVVTFGEEMYTWMCVYSPHRLSKRRVVSVMEVLTSI